MSCLATPRASVSAILAAAALLVAGLPLGLPDARASNVLGHHPDTGVPDDAVIVAIIDSGVDGPHPEFGGYRGQPGVADPQIVAWWDFSQHFPAPGQTWDTNNVVPYDTGFPHGTAMASLVGGQTVGAFPGVKLAVARATSPSGAYVHIFPAIEWALKTVGADVIVLGLGYQSPAVVGGVASMAAFTPEQQDEVLAEVAEAGALAVVSVKLLNPEVGAVASFTHWPSNAPSALAVSGTTSWADFSSRMEDTWLSTTFPDVLAWGWSTLVAEPGGGYAPLHGNSPAAAHVGGWAAKVMQAAMGAGQTAAPERIKQLLTWTADDMLEVPYAREGFGYVAHGAPTPFDTVSVAVAHAKAGTLPPPPAPETLAGGAVSSGIRRGGTEGAEGGWLHVPRGTSTPGIIGPSVPALRDVDGYQLRLEVGDLLEFEATRTGGVGNIDVYLYRPGAGALGLYSHNDIRAIAAHGGITESFVHRAVHAGDYTIMVQGWLVAERFDYAATLRVNGQDRLPVIMGDFTGVDPPPACDVACFVAS